MVHEDGQDGVRRPDEAGLRRGATPFEVLAGPDPEFEVGVEVRRLTLRDGKARSVHLALSGEIGGDFSAYRSLFGIGG